MKQFQIKIKKPVRQVGAVEFTGHFLGKNILEDVSWNRLDFSSEQNGKIADVADEIMSEEFQPETA